MKIKYITNAFSLNMLAELTSVIEIAEVSLEDAKALAEGAASAIGHADTAAVVGDVLGQTVAFNRVSVSLEKGDQVLVAQYIGPRLEEGATKLPAGAAIKFATIAVK